MTERDEAQALWAEQTVLPVEVDMTRIEDEATKFERAVRRRNVVELGAGAIVAVVFGAYAWWFEHPLARAGAIGVVAGVGVVAAVTLRYARAPSLPPADEPTGTFLEHYRAELLRQARVLAWVPVWYVLPLLVPAAVFAVGLHAHVGGEGSLARGLGAMAAVGLAVSALNLLAARRLRRKAAAL